MIGTAEHITDLRMGGGGVISLEDDHTFKRPKASLFGIVVSTALGRKLGLKPLSSPLAASPRRNPCIRQ